MRKQVQGAFALLNPVFVGDSLSLLPTSAALCHIN